MNISEEMRAQVLVDAMPYIQNYSGKVVVIKYGGAAMCDPALEADVMRDVVLLSLIGVKVVLVHGGGPKITETLERLSIPTRFVDGLRYTDEQTMEVVQMVLCGKVNKDLVTLLEQCGGKALGLCGMDGGMIRAKKHESEQDMGLVGDVTDVDVTPIQSALNNGFIPVVATVGVDEKGKAYNINADTAASFIASRLNAENLILLTDVRGLLRNKDEETSLIPVVNVSEVPLLIKQNIIQGGMIPKVDCCVEAVRRGVDRSFIIDGRIRHSILIEMFTREGIGTMFL